MMESVLLALSALIMMASLGMMYGTLLSPVLIGVGYAPLVVIPSLLLSQAIGDLSAVFCHHKFGNAEFNGLTRDVKVVLAMAIPGIAAVAVGAVVAVNLPGRFVKTYVALLVIIMSLLVFSKKRFKYKFQFHLLYGAIASFNKVISGGGFGPVTSTGGIIGGLESRVSVATTSFGELLICGASFVSYLCLGERIDVSFASALCAGAFIGGFLGPYVASRVNHDTLRIVISFCGILSGVWLLTKVF